MQLGSLQAPTCLSSCSPSAHFPPAWLAFSPETLQALSCMQAIPPYLPPFPQVSALRTVATYFRQHVNRGCPNRAGGNSVLIAPGDSDPAQPTFLVRLLNHCPHCAVQHKRGPWSYGRVPALSRKSEMGEKIAPGYRPPCLALTKGSLSFFFWGAGV